MSDNFFKISKGLNLTPQASEPANPSNGDIYFDSTLNKFRRYQNGSWGEFSSGGSGVNLITNGDAESDTNGWSTYADAAGTRPVDGTGGSPNVTFTRTTTNPLTSVGSFLLTKDAANRQGQGASYLFTVDPSYRAKVLTIEADYIVNSGTFTAGTSSTDSDVIFYLYDVTNSTLIEPSSFKLLSNNSSISDKFRSTFQTSATGSQYRLIMHCATTSASAYVVKFDNIKVTPSNYVYGTPITDWQSFTPTGSFTTNSTYTGVWRRIGDSMEVRTRIAFAGAPNSVLLTINIPSGFSIDTNKITNTVGKGLLADNGLTEYMLDVRHSNATTVAIYVINSSGTYGSENNVSQAVPITIGNTDSLDVFYSIPIVGWSSSVQMSDQTDTRVVAASFTGSTTSVTSALNTITPTTTLFDTHGAFLTNTYTVPISGVYEVNLTVSGSSGTSYAAGNSVAVYVQHNSTDYLVGIDRVAAAVVSAFGSSGTFLVNATVGDTLRFRAFSSVTTALSGTDGFKGSIRRISGPSAIAATENISARYTSAAGQSIANASTVIVDFGTKVRDSHGSVSTGVAWKFTAPISGNYAVLLHSSFANATFTAGNGINAQLFKNNSIYSILAQNTVQSTTTLSAFSLIGSDTVYLNAGDFIDIRIVHGEAAARSLLADTSRVRVSIDRVGN